MLFNAMWASLKFKAPVVIYPWYPQMNFGLLSFAALSAVLNFLSAARVGDFVKFSGLVRKPEYNGSVGLVQKLGQERHQVLKADDECIRNFTLDMDVDECMKSILVREANMTPVEWNEPEKLSLEQIISNFNSSGAFSSYAKREITAEEREVLDRVVLLIRAMCKDQPLELHQPEVTEKLRLIGAWINQRFDHHAMVYVCEAYEPLMDTIEWLWDRVGVWLR